MKRIFFIILIVIFILIAGFIYLYEKGNTGIKVAFIENIKNKNQEMKELNTVEGNYLLQMINSSTKSIKGKNYQVITGWVNANDINISDWQTVSLLYGELENNTWKYTETMRIDIAKVFVLENNKERPLNKKDLMTIQNDRMWTFQYMYKISDPYADNKLVLQRPNIEEKQLVANQFTQFASQLYDDRKEEIKSWDKLAIIEPIGFQGMKAIKDYNSDHSYGYNYILGMYDRNTSVLEYDYSDPENYITINNISKELPFDEKDMIDNRIVGSYTFRGKYLCSNFNGFCFFKIDNTVYNSKFVFDKTDNTIRIPGFSLVDLKFKEDKNENNNVIFSIEKDDKNIHYYISRNNDILQDIEDVRINVDKFVETNKELSLRLEKLNTKGTEIIFKGEYNLKTGGELVCKDIFGIDRLHYLGCILYPNALELQRTDGQAIN